MMLYLLYFRTNGIVFKNFKKAQNVRYAIKKFEKQVEIKRKTNINYFKQQQM